MVVWQRGVACQGAPRGQWAGDDAPRRLNKLFKAFP